MNAAKHEKTSKQETKSHKQNHVGILLWASLVLLVLALLATCCLIFIPKNLPLRKEEEKQNLPLQKQFLDTRKTVVIDAGHGGHDPGAIDTTQTIYEKDICRKMASKLAQKLSLHDGNIRVVFSHNEEEFSQPIERANLAIAENADLMISLHLNSDVEGGVRGFQCFPTPPNRVYHEESLNFANLLVGQVAKTSLPIKGTSGVYYSFYLPNGSGGFYKEIHDAGWLGDYNAIRNESFGVLEYVACPAVLVEQWYISNYEDMLLMNNDDGMNVMTDCLYGAVCAYFDLQAQI